MVWKSMVYGSLNLFLLGRYVAHSKTNVSVVEAPPPRKTQDAALPPCGCGCAYGRGNAMQGKAMQCKARQGNARQCQARQSNARQCSASTPGIHTILIIQSAPQGGATP